MDGFVYQALSTSAQGAGKKIVRLTMRYLPAEEILVMHARIVDATGGVHGVRDTGRILSAVERPKMQFAGKEFYPTVFDKAAAYFESIAFDHPFVDGNKRTALAVAARFLYLNGYELAATNQALERFATAAVKKKYAKDIVSSWLRKRVRKMQ